MVTLPRQIVRSFYNTDNGLPLMQQRWKLNTQFPCGIYRGTYYLLYHALQGEDWRKAFTPLTSRKIANGVKHSAVSALHYIHGSHIWSDEKWEKLLALYGQDYIDSMRAAAIERDELLLKPFGDTVSALALPRLRKVLPQVSYESKSNSTDLEPYNLCEDFEDWLRQN